MYSIVAEIADPAVDLGFPYGEAIVRQGTLMKRARRKRVMIVASGGGHWSQMLRVRSAFAEFDVFYVGVKDMYRQDVEPADFYSVKDFSRLQKWNFLLTFTKLAWIVLKERPVAVVTTGSAPGLIAVRLGRLLGARTAWIDSIANVEGVSFSGCKAGAVVDLWLTQWAHLSRPDGPHYAGSIL